MRSDDTAPATRAPLYDGGRAALAVLAWVLAAVAMRTALSPALKWDQAEQMLWSQQLAWGYGPQPPLYTWLQWGANALLGPSVLAAALVKGVLMALNLLFWALAAREVMPASRAPAAALGVLLLPVSLWIGVRDVTHTLLVSCAVAALWWLLLRQLRRPTAGGFAALGLGMAAALLSKYNAALAVAAMGAAALSVPQTRRALLSHGWPLAPLVTVLLLAPHAGWVASHWGQASEETLEKMHRGGSASGHWLAEIGAGLLSLLPLLLITLLPWALALTWAFGRRVWRSLTAPPAPDQPLPPPWLEPLLARYVALVLLGLLAMVAAGVTRFDARWLHPLLAAVVVLAFALLVRESPDVRAQRRWNGLLTALALAMLALPAFDAWRDVRRGAPDRFNWPVAAMARELRAAGYDGRSMIIADHLTLAGTLRTVFPQARVTDCDAAKHRAPACVAQHVRAAGQAGQGWLLVAAEDEAPPVWWAAAGPLDAPGAPMRHRPLSYRGAAEGSAPMRFVFRWQPPPAQP